MDSPTEVLFQTSVFDRLPLVDRLEMPKFPSTRDLQLLSGLAVKTSREYGVQMSQGITPGDLEQEKITYVKGESESIREPDCPEGAKTGVFFHTHYPTPLRRSICGIKIPYTQRDISWYMLPSDIGIPQDFTPKYFGGDINANWSSRALGGYLNITSPYGVSLFAGIRPLTNGENSLDDTQWTLQTGKQANRKFSARQLFRDSLSIPEDLMLWEFIWPKADAKYFLTLNWERFYNLESIFGDLRNLCFGDGLAELVKHLRYDFPSKDNLATLATTPYII